MDTCYQEFGIILRIPNFTTIESFIIVGGGKAGDIYDRMMEHAYNGQCAKPC